MRKLLIALLLTSSLFALSPFSLEGLKSVNVYIWDRTQALSKEYRGKIKADIEKRLKEVGIETNSNHYSNFLVTIDVLKVKDTHVVNLDLSIGEDVIITERKTKIDSIGNTFQRSTLFEAKDLENDISKTILNTFLKKLIEQYKDENL